jgi:hypothetical protein
MLHSRAPSRVKAATVGAALPPQEADVLTNNFSSIKTGDVVM